MQRQNRPLIDMIDPVVSAMGYELWGLEHLARGRRSLLRIYIDSEAGITLDDCERVSRQVTGTLDVEDPIQGAYDLEVSSPGLDRPLFTLAHFRRFVGSDVTLRLRAKLGGRRRLAGRIDAVGEDMVSIHTGSESVAVPSDLIEKARLVPQI